jgi:hypothetical protein
MNREEFRDYIESLGLRIGKYGIVSIPRAGDVFAITGDNTVRDTIGRESPIDEIKSVTVVGKTVQLEFTDGETESLEIGRFGPEEYSRFAAAVRIKNMPRTDSALADCFEELYPDYRKKMYYDVMTEREMYDPSLFNPDIESGKFIPFDDVGEYTYYQSVERRLEACGYDITKALPPVAVRLRVLITRFYETKKNLFLDWVKSLKWDGIPRVDTMFKTLFNARAPPLELNGYDDIYLAKLARAWLMGAVKRAENETKHEVVPVLIGSQGQGKSSVLQYLAVRPEWFSDSVADVSTAQGVNQFLDGVRGAIIVEISESKMIRTKDQESLKAFISKSSDHYRKPYARRDAVYPRHFILAATSNLEDVFTDVTGNRRYFPVICGKMDFSKRTPNYVTQLWAEAYQMHLAGELAYIPQSWAPAIEMQKSATQENPKVSTVRGWLDHPDNGLTEVGALIWREKLMSEMFGLGPSDLPTQDQDNAWKLWTRSTSTGWKKVPGTIRVYDGQLVKAWRRVSRSNFSVSAEGWIPEAVEEGAMMVKLNDEEGFEGIPLVTVYTDLCTSQGAIDENMPVDVSNLDRKYVNALVDDGYIYMDEVGTYRTVSALPHKDIY